MAVKIGQQQLVKFQKFAKSKKCDIKNRLTDFDKIWHSDATLALWNVSYNKSREF